jgi:hypothetical protein
MIEILSETITTQAPVREVDWEQRTGRKPPALWKIDAIDELAPPPPLCFDTHSDWRNYLLHAAADTRAWHRDGPIVWALVGGVRMVEANPDFNYCDDCTVKREADMRRAGRCVRRRVVSAVGKA